MDFTTNSRRKNLIDFMNFIKKNFKIKEDDEDEGGRYKYKNVSQMFDSVLLSSGVEGKVYKSIPKDLKIDSKKDSVIVIKKVNLKAIEKTKDIDEFTLNATPDQLYNLFFSTKSFKNPGLIEILSSTLVNQLILQKICPNYSFNYYWELEQSSKSIISYNEYINFNTFHSWARKKHKLEYWYNALFQIITALYAIKKFFNMLHTDFHTKNILVQKVKPGGYWTYIIDKKKYYLPNLGFIFLIHDFGFSWIPNKLEISWYYDDKLKYVNNNGLNYIDLENFVNSLLEDSYEIPVTFKKFLQSNFEDDIKYIYTKKYYQIMAKSSKFYKTINKTYPDIDKSYNGMNTSLGDKIYEIFSSNTKYFNYTKPIRGGQSIETYSLDKKFNINKLDKAFSVLVVNSIDT